MRKEVLIFLAVAFGISYSAWIVALQLPEGRSTALYAGFSFFAMIGPLAGTPAVKRLGWEMPPSAELLPRTERLWAALQGVGVLYLVLWVKHFGLQTLPVQWRGTAPIKSFFGQAFSRGNPGSQAKNGRSCTKNGALKSEIGSMGKEPPPGDSIR